jgi:hypothetical protein
MCVLKGTLFETLRYIAYMGGWGGRENIVLINKNATKNSRIEADVPKGGPKV